MEKSKGRKEKAKTVREFSAGGVVFKETSEKVLWLITKSTPSKFIKESKWRLPKGWIDDDDDKPGPYTRGERKPDERRLKEAAIREVKEEGGVEAEVVKKIDTYKYFFRLKGKNILKFVTFYLMEWKKDLPEGFGFESEEVSWLDYKKARKRLSYSGERKILDDAKNMLTS